MIVLITGPVRSGKSTRAVSVARAFGSPVIHVMTARLDPADREMAERVARHRAERGAERTLELWEPGSPDLASIVAAGDAGTVLLIDSLGTWLAGHLLDLEALVEADPVAARAQLEAWIEPLADALARARCHVVLVGEETGWGLVPVSAQGRLFRDALGRLAQRIGRLAARTELVVAGYAVDLCAVGVPVSTETAPVRAR
jgi:adenosylcobinamide kinase/adenosylcobinamide-phosphate guanylyltransferase